MISDPASRRRALPALLLLVPAPTLGVLFAMVWWPGPVGQAVFTFSKLWLVALPVVWHVLIDRQRVSISKPRRGGFIPGIVLGLVIAGIIALAYVTFAHAWIDADRVAAAAVQNGLAHLPTYILACLYWITVNSLVEEYVWRWFVYTRCRSIFPAGAGWLAVVVSAVLFTVHHVVAMLAQGFDVRAIILANLGVFTGGIVWSALYRRYQSIWPGYVSHAIVDIPIFVIGYHLIFAAA